MRCPFDEKVLKATRLNAASIVDDEVFEKTHKSIPGDENEEPRRRVSQGHFGLLDSCRKTLAQQSLVPQSSTEITSEKIGTYGHQDEKVGMDCEEVLNLNDIASGYALRGDEKTAINIYQRALTFALNEVETIQKRIENSMKEPEYRHDTIYQLFFCEWTDITQIIAETKMMMAVLYERMGDYDKAIKVCYEAKDVHELLLHFDLKDQSELLASVQESFFLVNHMAKKLEDARRTFDTRRHLHESALKIHGELRSTNDGKKREALFGALCDQLSAVLRLEVESLGQHHPQVAETTAFISKVHLEKKDRTGALKWIQRAVKTAEIALGMKHPNTGEKYYQLARQYEGLNRGKYDRAHAILFYEKALDSFGDAEGDHSRTFGSISNDMGVLLMQEGRYDEAIQTLNDALAVYDSMEKRHGDDRYADVAQVWKNIAKCYVRQKKWDKAAVSFLSALGVQREARKLIETVNLDTPTTDMPMLIRDESIVDTMKRLGKVYSAMHEYNKADTILLEALTIFQDACECFKANSKKVTPLELAAKQDQLANLVFCLAEVKEAAQNFDDAIKLYGEALELRTYSDKVRSTTNKVNHVHIAMCLAGIGKVRIAKGEHTAAFKAFNEAIQSARKEGKIQECREFVRT